MKRAAVALCCAAGCAHAPAGSAQPLSVAVPGSLVTVTSETAQDQGEVDTLAKVAGEAVPVIQRWGGVRVPTRIVVVPDHAALEERAGRPGFGWLRAWARYDVVYVQSPRTWYSFLFRPSHRALRQLLTHELTHCAMYQAISAPGEWETLLVPLWFREGMASWTAQESDKRYPLSDLRRFAIEHPDLDPLRQAELMVRSDSMLVYSAAHWAFSQLAAHGTDGVRQLLAGMRSGEPFQASFQAAFGESESAFEDQVLARWRRGSAGSADAESGSSTPPRL